MAYNQLSDAQIERLDMLTEELGEVIQVIGKIKRHGYKTVDHCANPPVPYDNKALLEKELADVTGIITEMNNQGDIYGPNIDTLQVSVWGRKLPYTHHQERTDIPPMERGR